jgi:hypothetical protein
VRTSPEVVGNDERPLRIKLGDVDGLKEKTEIFFVFILEKIN